MATLIKNFKKQSFPTRNKTDLPDAVEREANKAMENILEEDNVIEEEINCYSVWKCRSSEALCQVVSNSRKGYGTLVLETFCLCVCMYMYVCIITSINN